MAYFPYVLIRDYLYIPLGGNRKGLRRTSINVFIAMFLGGLWHGAHWKFVLWGVFHGAGLLINRTLAVLLGTKTLSHPAWTLCKWMTTYLFVCLGWVLFRAEDLGVAAQIYGKLFSWEPRLWNWEFLSFENLFFLPCMIIVHLGLHIAKRDSVFFKRGTFAAHLYIVLMTAIIFLFAPMDPKGFIYFQF
ncbi:MAG: MBOAT family O-acyltransferase [Nitrospinales bacterium]